MVLQELMTYLATYDPTWIAGANQTSYVDGNYYIYKDITPPDPDTVISLFEYGGLAIEPNLGTTGIRLEYPLVQVVVRGIKDERDAPELVANKILEAFTKVVNQTLSSVAYKAIMAKQQPFLMRRDENFRCYFACNYQVVKAHSST